MKINVKIWKEETNEKKAVRKRKTWKGKGKNEGRFIDNENSID